LRTQNSNTVTTTTALRRHNFVDLYTIDNLVRNKLEKKK